MSENTQLATAEPKPVKASALALMASRVSVEPEKMLSTLKETVFKGAKDAELLALVVVSNEYGLNPFLKEIYAFPAKGGGIVPVVSIDGWISMINRQSQLDGIEFDMSNDGEECTCRIFIKDRAHPVTVTEYKSECLRSTEPWKMMPKRMLRHKSLIQAARVAFGFSGIYEPDEAEKIAEGKVVSTGPTAVREPIGPFSKPAPELTDSPDTEEADFTGEAEGAES